MTLDAVVLAAGAGTRFGGRKLTAPWRGGVLLDGALAAALAAPVKTVIVVHGVDVGVCDAATAFFHQRGEGDRLRLVYACDHADGMSASLRAGIEAVPNDREGVFLFLGDMPNVPHEITRALADALTPKTPAVSPVWQGRRGHPVLFARSLFPDLLTCRGDGGAREVLRNLGGRLASVAAAHDGILMDVDEPRDLDSADSRKTLRP